MENETYPKIYKDGDNIIVEEENTIYEIDKECYEKLLEKLKKTPS